jgi:hypothetical protein
MGKMPLALTVSMYSDFVDLRATGAGLVDMVARHCCFLSQLECIIRYMSIRFPRVDQNSTRLSTQDVVVRSMK